MVDLLNALKLSFKKASLTAALKRRLLELWPAINFRVYYQMGEGLKHKIVICCSILYAEISKKKFYKLLLIFSLPLKGFFRHVPQISGKKQTKKVGKVFS